MRYLAACLGSALVLAATGCNTYADNLARSQRAFEASEHERALAVLRVLEPDLQRLSLQNRAHYAYLRGMTDFRIGYKGEARHWLAFAAAVEQEAPGSLPPDWTRRLAEALKDLNEAVYSGGVASLSNTPSSTGSASGGNEEEDDSAPAKAAPKTEDEEQ